MVQEEEGYLLPLAKDTKTSHKSDQIDGAKFISKQPSKVMIEASSEQGNRATNRYVEAKDMKMAQSSDKEPLLSKNSFTVPPSPMSGSAGYKKRSIHRQNNVDEHSPNYVNNEIGKESHEILFAY